MVSPLWRACADGDVQKVHELLNDPSSVDLEVKDQNGFTPLIQAIRHGHIGIASILLGRGADPLNASNQGRPEDFTSDPSVLELLSSAKEKFMASGLPSTGFQQADTYSHEANGGTTASYYGQPQANFLYYPSVHPIGMIPEGAVSYYPPPSQQNGPPSSNPSQPDVPGVSNLPPPEIARLIPCRYFPACRYGASCMFAHPTGPYYPAPLPPPTQYTVSYDPMSQQPYSAGYYAVPTAPYPAPNGVSLMTSPMSPTTMAHHTPTPPIAPTRPPNEVMSPVQGPFSPQGPPPGAYTMTSPLSPSYSHPGVIPIPIGIAQLPPPQQIALQNQPPSVMFSSNPPVVAVPGPGVGHRREASIPFAGSIHPAMDNNMQPQSPPIGPQPDGFGPRGPLPQRDTMGHTRRGNGRRSSVPGGSRKPPCLFFPAGRCRNGDDCRFPHIMPESSGPNSNKFGSRARNFSHAGNGVSLDEKMASLSLQQEKRNSTVSPPAEGRPYEVNGSPRPTINGNGKHNHNYNHAPNGNANANGNGNSHTNNTSKNNDKRNMHSRQRIPNPDDFPVLAGSTTPPSRSPGPNGRFGPTAAQVLQAPPPTRKESFKEATLNGSSNGDAVDNSPSPSNDVSEEKSVTVTTNTTTNGIRETIAPKPVHATFAAVASSTPDSANQVSVSA